MMKKTRGPIAAAVDFSPASEAAASEVVRHARCPVLTVRET